MIFVDKKDRKTSSESILAHLESWLKRLAGCLVEYRKDISVPTSSIAANACFNRMKTIKSWKSEKEISSNVSIYFVQHLTSVRSWNAESNARID